MIQHLYLKAGLALGALYLVTRKPKNALTPDPGPTPSPEPVLPPPPAPLPPPGPNPFPDNQSTASVGASSGLRLRSGPSETSAQLELMPYNSFVAILDATQAPGNATPAAPSGWFQIKSAKGNTGWASAEFLVFGTDKERGMTPEEEAAYHERESHREAPIYDGVLGDVTVDVGPTTFEGTRAPRFGASYGTRRRTAAFAARPARALAITRLRLRPDASSDALATIAPGEVLQTLKRSGGWVLARYRDRHAPLAAIVTGWVPANVLGAA